MSPIPLSPSCKRWCTLTSPSTTSCAFKVSYAMKLKPALEMVVDWKTTVFLLFVGLFVCLVCLKCYFACYILCLSYLFVCTCSRLFVRFAEGIANSGRPCGVFLGCFLPAGRDEDMRLHSIFGGVSRMLRQRITWKTQQVCRRLSSTALRWV